ncbi:hypothetical protein [Tenacibaculum aiptasiae]|uniref:hypothetical protein n=1 Tax=Tenacibaculum aiptasiae TaxID=426481 RepID=UPI00232C82B9|nr:hypothetical protein [Tenacibaculum aiptasiae]
MRSINDLNLEIVKLVDNFKNDRINIEETIILLERLIRDFQLISNTDIKTIELLKSELNDALKYIYKTKLLDKAIKLQYEEIQFYESKLGLI